MFDSVSIYIYIYNNLYRIGNFNKMPKKTVLL